ncbi:hypothetical protein ACQPZ2_01405 [Nocardia pseudovaccinii]|uniref:hypothetical protein n=1 Tax=Nocardia pseudovaccinii TaxID=189540 RepID=UPI003D8FC3A3
MDIALDPPVTVVLEYVDAFNNGDSKAMAALCADPMQILESDPESFGPDLKEAFAGQSAGLCGAAIPGALWLYLDIWNQVVMRTCSGQIGVLVWGGR